MEEKEVILPKEKVRILEEQEPVIRLEEMV